MVTIVYDNSPGDKELLADWGFGCVVEGLPKTILFDTGGRGNVLLHNMQELGIEPRAIDLVVLSHIHGDHTGGLADFLRENSDVDVFMPAAFPEHFKSRARHAGANVIETEKGQQVCPGASTTPVSGDAIKEQGLYLETAEGIVVITGCAHPGIINVTGAAREASGERVYAVLGGFHMSGASNRQLSDVIDAFREMGVRRVGPCHCSGDETRNVMKEAFGADYMELGVGSRISFPKPQAHEEED
ncbi:MAG: MBL fold metallo-hydrolase [Candidatus Brocadiae bacterium]|nr:MBL fold metallo-hydrolase [Candidatus Brocadiia bacterium]